MPDAFVHLRHESHYRHEAFVKGLERLGYRVRLDEPATPLKRRDLAVIWNKTTFSRRTIEMGRQGEGAVIVCENGYYGKDAEGHQNFAMALDGHNGSGRWHVGSISRLAKLKIEFQPWRQDVKSRKVLIADQRGIGSPQMASPANFAHQTAVRLRGWGYEPIIRQHPGGKAPAIPLMEELEGCRALVVWSSNSATAALIAGYPAFYVAPHIVSEGASQRLTQLGMQELPEPDRFLPFRSLAWAQWSPAEIESGRAIDTLMQVHLGALPANTMGLGL